MPPLPDRPLPAHAATVSPIDYLQQRGFRSSVGAVHEVAARFPSSGMSVGASMGGSVDSDCYDMGLVAARSVDISSQEVLEHDFKEVRWL